MFAHKTRMMKSQINDIDLETENHDTFLNDVINGLTKSEKTLPSKYFYNAEGDVLFQKIMHCDDYYLTRSEMDIFKNKTEQLAEPFLQNSEPFELIELGAGDGSKTKHLLQYLTDKNVPFTYSPIDISEHILSVLEERLSQDIPELKIKPENGDYFDALKRICDRSNQRKVVLFLGSNIGNMVYEDAIAFCSKLSSMLSPKDLVLIGFDLKKDPQTILQAYNDSTGYTAQFNLNLLQRMNNELHADFELNQFVHYPTYNPQTGACKSFLISQQDQTVQLGDEEISFKKYEPIFMEVSRKFSLVDIRNLAEKTGFEPISHNYDSKQWFTDVLWQVK